MIVPLSLIDQLAFLIYLKAIRGHFSPVTVIERMPKGDLEDDDRDALAAFLKTL